jgi:hypothetical protein
MNPLRVSGQLNQLKQMMQTFSSPEAFLQANPEFNSRFQAFKQENANKTLGQIANENGIDLQFISQFLR